MSCFYRDSHDGADMPAVVMEVTWSVLTRGMPC